MAKKKPRVPQRVCENLALSTIWHPTPTPYYSLQYQRLTKARYKRTAKSRSRLVSDTAMPNTSLSTPFPDIPISHHLSLPSPHDDDDPSIPTSTSTSKPPMPMPPFSNPDICVGVGLVFCMIVHWPLCLCVMVCVFCCCWLLCLSLGSFLGEYGRVQNKSDSEGRES